VSSRRDGRQVRNAVLSLQPTVFLPSFDSDFLCCCILSIRSLSRLLCQRYDKHHQQGNSACATQNISHKVPNFMKRLTSPEHLPTQGHNQHSISDRMDRCLPRTDHSRQRRCAMTSARVFGAESKTACANLALGGHEEEERIVTSKTLSHPSKHKR
jgi:hypothetical protein